MTTAPPTADVKLCSKHAMYVLHVTHVGTTVALSAPLNIKTICIISRPSQARAFAMMSIGVTEIKCVSVGAPQGARCSGAKAL